MYYLWAKKAGIFHWTVNAIRGGGQPIVGRAAVVGGVDAVAVAADDGDWQQQPQRALDAKRPTTAGHHWRKDWVSVNSLVLGQVEARWAVDVKQPRRVVNV